MTFFEYGNSIADKHSKVKTAQSYRTALNSFQQYFPGVAIEELTYSMGREYVERLQRDGKSVSAVRAYVSALRAIYKQGELDGLVDGHDDPFHYRPPREKLEVHKAIDFKEFRRLIGVSVKSERLQYAQDITSLQFLLRGMSIIDLVQLKAEQYQDGYINYIPEREWKRSNPLQLKVKVCQQAKEIIARYRSQGEYLLALFQYDVEDHRHGYQSFLRRHNERMKQLCSVLCLKSDFRSSAPVEAFDQAAKEKTHGQVYFSLVGKKPEDYRIFGLMAPPQEVLDIHHQSVVQAILNREV